MKRLHLGVNGDLKADFSLPLDSVTQTLAILAKKGAGKSYTASVVVEELLDAGQIPVIVDPTGAWWGLKSSADGKAAAYPVVVFGGEHGDLPLEENAGEVLARAIVEQRFPAIIDLSLFRKGQVRRFITPFLETIYRLNRLPLMLVVDEADDICPQKPFGDEAQMVGALEDVVKRGRKKGIGCTLITQRPADLAKQVLTQCEMLIAMRLTHPLDIKAVMEWINVHADLKQAAKMVESLPSLPVGTAWFWSPGWGDIFEKVEVRKRRTFDSGATPKAGETQVVPKKLAQIDIVALGSEITAAAKRAKDNDPRTLLAKVVLLQQKLKLAEEAAAEHAMAHMDMAKVAPAQIRVDVAVLTDRDRALLADCGRLLAECGERITHAEKLLTHLHDELTEKLAAMAGPAAKTQKENSNHLLQPPPQSRYQTRSDNDQYVRRQREGVAGDSMPKGERTMLTGCAQYADGVGRDTLTVLTGFKRSTRDAYVQRLRDKGLVEVNGDRIIVTRSGIDALGSEFKPLPTGAELLAHWLARLPEGERHVLNVAVNEYPKSVLRDVIDGETGYKRSTRDAYLQRLEAKRLVVLGRGTVTASANLFD